MRVEHRECRFVLRLQARLRLGDADACVLLETRVCVGAPAAALANQLDFRRALARHHRLDRRAEVHDIGSGHLAERRALIAEDARVAILIRGDSPA
jgi:hypothetical protein